MNAREARPLGTRVHLGDPLTAAQLASVNQVLRYHGIAEVGPCRVGEVLERFNGFKMRRFCHLLRRLAVALDEVQEVQDERCN